MHARRTRDDRNVPNGPHITQERYEAGPLWGLPRDATCVRPERPPRERAEYEADA